MKCFITTGNMNSYLEKYSISDMYDLVLQFNLILFIMKYLWRKFTIWMFCAPILLSWQDFPYYRTNKLWNKKIYFCIQTKSPYQVLSSLCVHCPHQCPLRAFHISFFLSEITGAKRTKLNNKNVNMVVLNIFYGIFSSFWNSILAKI